MNQEEEKYLKDILKSELNLMIFYKDHFYKLYIKFLLNKNPVFHLGYINFDKNQFDYEDKLIDLIYEIIDEPQIKNEGELKDNIIYIKTLKNIIEDFKNKLEEKLNNKKENKMEKNILGQKLTFYLKLKNKLKCKLVIVDSTALQMQGFSEFINETNDLDLGLINPSNEDLKIIKDLEFFNPNLNLSDRKEKYSGLMGEYFIILNGIKIDFFILEDPFNKEIEKGKICDCCDMCERKSEPLDQFKIINEKDLLEIKYFDNLFLVFNIKRILEIRKILNRKKDWSVLFKISNWLIKDFEINNIN